MANIISFCSFSQLSPAICQINTILCFIQIDPQISLPSTQFLSSETLNVSFQHISVIAYNRDVQLEVIYMHIRLTVPSHTHWA